MIHLDSSFLIDLLRETGAGRPDAALDFIEHLDDGELLVVSVHVVCELRAGCELSRHPARAHADLDRLLGGLLVAYPDDRFGAMYAGLLASIQRSRRSIAAMDLLIGTAAMLDDAPIVTRNVKDFSRIPGLRVLAY
jgi:predicted nucleic acid-binding protein